MMKHLKILFEPWFMGLSVLVLLLVIVILILFIMLRSKNKKAAVLHSVSYKAERPTQRSYMRPHSNSKPYGLIILCASLIIALVFANMVNAAMQSSGQSAMGNHFLKSLFEVVLCATF